MPLITIAIIVIQALVPKPSSFIVNLTIVERGTLSPAVLELKRLASSKNLSSIESVIVWLIYLETTASIWLTMDCYTSAPATCRHFIVEGLAAMVCECAHKQVVLN